MHRRAEVGHVKAPAQAFRQARFQELDHYVLALHPHIHTHLVVWQRDHNATGTVQTAAEVKILDGQAVAVAVFRERGTRRRCRRRTGHRIEHHQQGLALYQRLVSSSLLEVEHHPRPVACLHHTDRAQIALVNFNRGTPHAIGDAREVERDARWCLDRKTSGNRVQWLGKVDTNHFCPTLQGSGNRFDARLRMRHQRSQRQGQTQQ